VTVVVLGYGVFFYATLPDVAELKTKNPATTSFIDEFRREDPERKIKWGWTPLTSLPPQLLRAVLVAEDAGFYDHHGFDFAEIFSALKEFGSGKPLRGASTISQQLAKNLYLSASRNPLRKLREAVITYQLEQALSKRRILEIYLNIIEWGAGKDSAIFGIKAAAEHYFHKSPQSLTSEEIAFLVAIIPSPTGKFNPQKHPRRVKNRQQKILRKM
jgi:monofunctional biosynthetic peptidoglycan transglycosylase